MVSDTHSLYDDRIYWKEAISLSQNGYKVYHINLSHKAFAETSPEGIFLESVAKASFNNKYADFLLKPLLILSSYRRLFKKLKSVKADAYHLHDLKLLSLTGFLKRLQFKPAVIYDAHEPYPEAFLFKNQKSWIKGRLRKLISDMIRRFENYYASKVNFIIATEDNVCNRFKALNANTDIIYNYSNLSANNSGVKKEFEAIYCGGISRLRGAMKMLKLVKVAKDRMLPFRLVLVGTIFEDSLKQEMDNYIEQNKLEDRITITGNIPYNEVVHYYERSKMGLIFFQKNMLHETILPIKLFEYMSFGLPIFGSQVGYIKSYIEKFGCGVQVNINEPEATFDNMWAVLNDSKKYKELSENSQKAADNFKWETMSAKLASIYRQLLNNKVS